MQDVVTSMTEVVWQFTTFYHPQAIPFRRLLEARGLPRLLRTENQVLTAGTDVPVTTSGRNPKYLIDYFDRDYSPTRYVAYPRPRDIVDFTLTGPYSECNWELFFDAPLYCAKMFDADGQFANAEEFYGLLIDRNKATDADMWTRPELFKTAPIRRAVEIEEGINRGAASDIINEYTGSALADQFARIHLNPYQPHLIARGWPSVYARALRIHYAQHLIHWADHEYRLAYLADDRNRLEIASETYDRAARVVGLVQDKLPPLETDGLPCLSALATNPQNSLGPLQYLEPYLPASVLDGMMQLESQTWASQAYFCIPDNDRLDELRATVAKSLLNLRHCLDIEGVK